MAKEEKYDVTGMTCAACSAAVGRSVKKVPGVDAVNVQPFDQQHECGV